ncbi:MAG: PLP-dependent aminotransferase family protein [Deltaproteobacteria bacterium]|nr:PLP-dependent aminotransferase family protein [Deltaproteobacteria bacterium]
MHLEIERLQHLASERGVLSLAGGLPDPSLFPRHELQAACASAIAAPRADALQYAWPEGSAKLRAWIAERLTRRGARIGADDVIVTSGAQQALSIASALVISRGTLVRVDQASYPGALDLLRRAGAVLTGDGARPEVAYLMPGVRNPTGDALSAEAQHACVAAARYVIADEAYAELRFDGQLPPLALATARERTFHLGTFSKTLCPGLRIGFLVPPPSFLEKARALKQERDLRAPTLSQAMLEHPLLADRYDELLSIARRTYASRAERLVAAIRRHLPRARFADPEGGFSVFVETGVRGDAVSLLERAITRGVTFDPGLPFLRTGRSDEISFRLCHSTIDPRCIEFAVARLASALATFVQSRTTHRLAAVAG